ncbi:hypothetical protein GGI20_004248 [Coemansia sp. BCRC 34301]|nr:hypothetical protein GGI20_004248 [Coemansia sp. BCRC 34301]
MDSASTSTSARPPLAAIRRPMASQSRRHAPYARPAANSQRSDSFTERVLGICKQISKPLFGRGAMLASSGDAFVAPWRTVDRETYELREELYRARCEAAAFDQRQLKQAEEDAQDSATTDAVVGSTRKVLSAEEIEESGSSGGPAVAPVAAAQSSYESVFATARALGERRATGLANVEQVSAKGKDVDYSLPVAAVSCEDEEEEDDNDFEPQDADGDDDEEEALQRDMEPIDEAEEVTTPAGSAYEQSSATTSCVASPSNSQMAEPPHLYQTQQSGSESESEPEPELSVSSETSDRSIELSAVEESSVTDEDSASESEQDEIALPASIEEPLESELPSETDEGDLESMTEPEEANVQVLEDESSGLDSLDMRETTDEAGASSGEDDSELGSVGDESDQMTEEIATMSSEEELSDAEAEAEPELEPAEPEVVPEVEPTTAKANDSALMSPSRSWWPFSGRSLFNGQDKSQNDQPVREKRETAHESGSSDSSYPEPTKRNFDSYTPAPSSHVHSVYARHRLSQRTGSVQAASPYVPASFIDFSKSAMTSMGKRMRSVERSGLRHSAFLANRRHTASVAVPAVEKPPLASDLAPLPTPLNRVAVSGPKRMHTAAETPTVTAASLGLEARRSISRGQALQQRRQTSLYYGSGYGSHSAPYAFNIAHGAPEAAVSSTRLAQTKSAQEISPGDDVAGAKSGSITAQKILDIISEVPPARSQASLDPHGVVNPYELSSPYSVRMRPATTQRRRVLVPLSLRLSQSSSADSAKTVTHNTDNSSNSNSNSAILDSIQLAAPPEVQAELESTGVLKAIQTNRQTPKRYLPPPLPTKRPANAPSPTAKKGAVTAVASQSPGVASPKSITKTLSSTSPSSLAARLAAKGQPAPTPLDQLAKSSTAAEPVAQPPKQPFSLGVPKLVPKTAAFDKASSTPPPPVRAQSSTPKPAVPSAPLVAKSAEAQPAKVLEAVAAPADRPAPRATATALATSEMQLPVFSFVLPKTTTTVRSRAAKRKAEELSVSQLPTFAFTLEATKARGASRPSSKPAPTPALEKAADWTCDVCDLKSPLSATQCIVCEAPKPAPALANAPSTLPAANSWASSGFTPSAPKDGEWVCDTCELKNSVEASKCTVCDAAKPMPKPQLQTVLAAAVAPVPNLWAQSGFKVAKPKDGEWTCDMCELTNSGDASKCVVCDSAKPGLPVPVAAAPATAPAPVSVLVPNLWAQSGFKAQAPKDGQWICDTCELSNGAAALKCTVCDAPKPVPKSAVPSMGLAVPSAKKRVSDLDDSQLPVFSFDLDVSKKPTAPKC